MTMLTHLNQLPCMQSLELESLLKSTLFIETELATIRRDVQREAKHGDQPASLALTYLERAIRLRQSFRAIADGIEGKRSLAQLQKEKIEKSKNYLEGLQYYKTTLMNKIKDSHVDSLNLTQFYNTPLEVNDWVKDYQQVEQHIKSELQQKEQQKSQLQQLIQEKADRQTKSKSTHLLYQKTLPDKAQKLYKDVMETAKLCNVQEFQSISGIVSPSLSIIYDKIIPLRVDKTLEVTLSSDSYEELEITILKTDFCLFKQANRNKIGLTEKEVKITIASLEPELSQLVIGIDRREDYNNEEVFQRLINNEQVKPVFAHPKNESQRNMNAKFVRVNWLEGSLLTGILTPSNLVSTIKQRLFSLMLVDHIKDSIKKIGFFFPLTSEQERQGSVPFPSNIKKSSSGSLDKITFSQFLEQVHIPSWVEKYRLKYLEMEHKRSQMDFEQQRAFVIDKTNYLHILSVLKLEELDEAGLNSYYKGTLTTHANTLEFVIIIPFAYPQKPSRIVITNWLKKEEEKKPQGLEGIPCKARVNPSRKTFSSKILSFERAVNDEMGQFFKGPESHSFLVLLQMNRLISLLGMNSQKRA